MKNELQTLVRNLNIKKEPIHGIWILLLLHKTKEHWHFPVLFLLNQRLPILPGGLPPSTFGVCRLNCCVRHGNRWIPTAIATELFIFQDFVSWQLHKKYHFFNVPSTLGNLLWDSLTHSELLFLHMSYFSVLILLSVQSKRFSQFCASLSLLQNCFPA